MVINVLHSADCNAVATPYPEQGITDTIYSYHEIRACRNNQKHGVGFFSSNNERTFVPMENCMMPWLLYTRGH